MGDKVIGVQPMQADEILAVVRHHSPPVLDGKPQHIVIWNGVIGLACFPRGQDIVPQLSQTTRKGKFSLE